MQSGEGSGTKTADQRTGGIKYAAFYTGLVSAGRVVRERTEMVYPEDAYGV